jgi:hypothetical protein
VDKRTRLSSLGEVNAMTSRDLWTYSSTTTGMDTDVTGFSVEAIDGGIGKVDVRSRR